PYRAVIHSTATRSTLGPLGPSIDITTETERIFEYEAERYDARYGVDATVTLEIGGGPPLVVNVKHADSKRAFEHDVRCPDANVYLQRANLPDVNAWLTTFLGTKRSALLRKLRGRWAKAFCGHSSYTPEEAARCLQAGQRVPQAEQALHATFGGDGQMVVDDLARSRADERQPAAAPKAPEVQEVPQVDVGESI
ncbi:MAG TPA: hypothetical protein VLT58_12335, partial [Polyangia bacterium]|nr:hypothetical protein [Polyangia bacterium]